MASVSLSAGSLRVWWLNSYHVISLLAVFMLLMSSVDLYQDSIQSSTTLDPGYHMGK